MTRQKLVMSDELEFNYELRVTSYELEIVRLRFVVYVKSGGRS